MMRFFYFLKGDIQSLREQEMKNGKSIILQENQNAQNHLMKNKLLIIADR